MKQARPGFRVSRRQVLKAGVYSGASLLLPWGLNVPSAQAARLTPRLSDPAIQPKFVEYAPNALAPGFKYQPDRRGRYNVDIRQAWHQTGLRLRRGGRFKLWTRIWGYGDRRDKWTTWPGRTFEIQSGKSETHVRWRNKLNNVRRHLLPVDTNLHWCYSLEGMSSANGQDYSNYTIRRNGVPIITHLHGGHSDFQFDGNPEFFYSPKGVVGPQWDFVDGGFTTRFRYDDHVPAGILWYHDHALGITRLNVYAGMAGFYIVRDQFDTGGIGPQSNDIGLPKYPYELAYAIQDRMFTRFGQLFYSAFPGDPFYDDFITGEGAVLPPDLFPGGGPTALAEFFGDHMVVNGKIWPKEDVEPRNYRMRLLNGTDSRFLVIRFRMTDSLNSTTLPDTNIAPPLPFTVIGSDQGLASSATEVDTLVFEPGGRYDIVFDFSQVPADSRVIMENLGGDAPFGGAFGADLEPEDLFPDRQTDRIMAFDVVLPMDYSVPDDFNSGAISHYRGNTNVATRTRKVALFEGKDEFGRLQPLLGTAEPATDYLGNEIHWPATQANIDAGLEGQMEGAIPWHSPTTENPDEGDTEIWEIYNATGDAHPVHLHLVNFEVLDRYEFTADVVDQPVVQHNGTVGNGFRLENIVVGNKVDPGPEYVENAPKDMVTALPDQVTRIKMTFDKPGRYVWHCHILSHEDHEMMRVLHVGPEENGHHGNG
ncbi:MAG: multicopper oxidase domain-containing protein [Desulfosarcinaceae bacterium]|nr:multicopper oxidase domain-containing protein [Desulfosarcinaceae bacterium]